MARKSTLGPSMVAKLGGVTAQAHVEKSSRLPLGGHIDEASPGEVQFLVSVTIEPGFTSFAGLHELSSKFLFHVNCYQIVFCVCAMKRAD